MKDKLKTWFSKKLAVLVLAGLVGVLRPTALTWPFTVIVVAGLLAFAYAEKK